jgi:hypothetical protein
MTGSINWTRVKNRAQKQRQGTEDKKTQRSAFNTSFKKRTPGPKLTKDEQRAQAEKALAEWKARQGPR